MKTEQKKQPTMYNKLAWYRLFMFWSYVEFAKRIGVPYDVARRSLAGDTVPFDYHQARFKKYYKKNQAEIDEAYDAISSGEDK